MRLNILKFKSLTEFTGNPNFLGYQGANAFFQTINTPYEATFIMRYIPTEDASNSWLYLGNLAFVNESQTPALPSDIGFTYLPKYKIYDISYNINVDNVKIELDEHNNGESYPSLHLVSLNKSTNFTSSQSSEIKVPCSFDYEMQYPGDGTKFSELTFLRPPHIDILNPPLTRINGYIKMSIKYYDKYLMYYDNS